MDIFSTSNNEHPTSNYQLDNMETKKKYDLEERLLNFSLLIIKMIDLMPSNKVGNHLSGQLIRSGTSPLFNYGEAHSAESQNDFIHKMKICLKELRETILCFKLIKRSCALENDQLLESTIKENDELFAIFSKSIDTAKSKK